MSTYEKINELASVHLGKAGDGSVVKPYVTPDSIDKSLLVGIPRILNREHYNIDEQNLPFIGIDTWNGYEFSCLLDNGFPLSGWIRWSYSSDSVNIVESKSAKLYLNSYNMAKMGKTILGAVENVKKQVLDDMSTVLGLKSKNDLSVELFVNEVMNYADPMDGVFTSLEETIDVENIKFDHYNEDPRTLEVIKSDGSVKRYSSKSLRSNCRVTNQPDWGDVFVHIKGAKTVTPESLLQYIVSMRKENHFHEEICECVYKRLHDLLEPEELMVACLYTRRGGIDINPVRASSTELLHAHNIVNASSPTAKTMRQ